MKDCRGIQDAVHFPKVTAKSACAVDGTPRVRTVETIGDKGVDRVWQPVPGQELPVHGWTAQNRVVKVPGKQPAGRRACKTVPKQASKLGFGAGTACCAGQAVPNGAKRRQTFNATIC